MKLSYQWLKEWVAFDASPASLAEQLTRGGLEVDAIEHLGEGLEGVVVAEIEHAEPHPNADRLRVCQVKGDSEPRTIVCGAPNARAGLRAPLATLGATLPNGMTIKRAKLRGVGSEGYLNLDDAVLDVDLTPNRADCLSIQGMAREVAALLKGRFSPPSFDEAKVVSEATVPIAVSAPEDCPVYLARVISKVDVNQASPLWMQERLRRAGVRPISVVVDVTNYVMLELGQPMHAFDAEALAGGIEVRRAQPAESLTLLDGQTIELDQECLVIADHAHAVALAGVMGGADSAVGEGTETIVLESAWFDPAVVAGRARRFGLHTESSHRFERGVDPTLQAHALERATALIVEIAGGEPGPKLEACAPDHRPGTATVELSVGHVNRVLGTALTLEAVQAALEALAMTCQRRGD
jgi:phenylalanyl-tRNA synthetase beta chain